MNPPPGILALPNGQWVLEHDSHLSRWAEQHDTIVTDPHLFKFLDPYLRDAKVVYDLGANIGDHARHYADLGKQVVAFEPNPLAFTCLEHNVPEALCLPYAASDADGSLNFTILDNVGASRVTKDGEWSVEAKRIDGLGLPDPDFVKIDCEGWEPLVIDGMSETLNRCLPILFVEVNRGALEANGFKPQDLLDRLIGRRYYNPQFYPRNAQWGDEQFDLLFLPLPQP